MTLEMRLKLNAPGMTSLHKAGLAGLFMTLRAFEEKEIAIDGLSWQLEPQQITLRWTDTTPKNAFENLIKESFRIERGFLCLTGLEADGEMNLEQRHFIYEAITHSFFQHGPHCPKEKNKRPLIYHAGDMDDKKLCWIKDFAPIIQVKPYDDASKRFLESDGTFKKFVEAKGWLYPGAVKRHEIHKATTLNEPSNLALVLMYAPVGVLFYKLKSRSKGRKARFAMVIPEIQDLQAYFEFRRVISTYNTIEMTASSASDAALRFITHLAGSDAWKPLSQLTNGEIHCRIITFGIVAWDEKHKTRTFTHSVFSEHIKGLENYRIASSIFPNHWQEGEKLKDKDETGKKIEKDSYFVANSTAREFISDNIAQGRDWHSDFSTFLSHKETRKGLSFPKERERLNKMVKEADLKASERLFIDVCQDSWRGRMRKLSDRAGREGADRGTLIQKEFEKLRTSISHSRNAHTLRETVVDLWARAGRTEKLDRNNLQDLLPFFDEKNWRKARDLALLALISYQPKDDEEKKLLSTDANKEEDGTNV